MRVEVKDGYCTGNYAIVGGSCRWVPVDELPTTDMLKLKSYKYLGESVFEFDEVRYEELIAEQTTNGYILEKQSTISKLQETLNNTDYQIIKCYEYNLAGKELPYDISELHEERQNIRDKINLLELEIAELSV